MSRSSYSSSQQPLLVHCFKYVPDGFGHFNADLMQNTKLYGKQDWNELHITDTPLMMSGWITKWNNAPLLPAGSVWECVWVRYVSHGADPLHNGMIFLSWREIRRNSHSVLSAGGRLSCCSVWREKAHGSPRHCLKVQINTLINWRKVDSKFNALTDTQQTAQNRICRHSTLG
jgi:hypothetical protein